MPDSQQQDKLRTRLLVIFLGVPGLLIVIWLGGWVYVALVATIVLLGLREYHKLLQAEDFTPRIITAYLSAIAILAIYIWQSGLVNGTIDPERTGTSFLATIFLVLIILQILEVVRPSKGGWANLALNMVGIIWIAGFSGSFLAVRFVNFSYPDVGVDVPYRLTLALFVSVWICDALAYLIGKAFGKRKILPSVSPKKTVTGTVAGLIGAVLTMVILGYTGVLPMGVFPLTHVLILGVIAGGVGQMGDFVESRLKRDFKVKDTGTLLPGHGGVLDRFDSLLFVMPVTYLFLILIS
ncbi:phosphatidate cytidylyltransferase [Candidatus Neomarinimicrobiota bacterium]